MFASQSQAKQFFVEKVLAQAAAEGQRLSEAERWMLRFSESDPEFVVDPPRVIQREQEISDEQYEAKIAALLARRYEHEVESDSGARDVYRQAYATPVGHLH